MMRRPVRVACSSYCPCAFVGSAKTLPRAIDAVRAHQAFTGCRGQLALVSSPQPQLQPDSTSSDNTDTDT